MIAQIIIVDTRKSSEIVCLFEVLLVLLDFKKCFRIVGCNRRGGQLVCVYLCESEWFYDGRNDSYKTLAIKQWPECTNK